MFQIEGEDDCKGGCVNNVKQGRHKPAFDFARYRLPETFYPVNQ